jgi:hypothetical protein
MLDMDCQLDMWNRVSRHLYIGQYGMELDNVDTFWRVSTHGTVAVDTGFYSRGGISQG